MIFNQDVVTVLLITFGILINISQWYYNVAQKENISFENRPWTIARAKIPPVLVPPIQSKLFLIGWPVTRSMAKSSWIRTKPRIPPPSRHKTCQSNTNASGYK